MAALCKGYGPYRLLVFRVLKETPSHKPKPKQVSAQCRSGAQGVEMDSLTKPLVRTLPATQLSSGLPESRIDLVWGHHVQIYLGLHTYSLYLWHLVPSAIVGSVTYTVT